MGSDMRNRPRNGIARPKGAPRKDPCLPFENSIVKLTQARIGEHGAVGLALTQLQQTQQRVREGIIPCGKLDALRPQVAGGRGDEVSRAFHFQR